MRIDKLLVDRGLAESRERARALIMAGDVLVGNTPVLKAGAGVDSNAEIRLRRPEHPFVGRGGVKLSGALEAMAIDPEGWIAADIGASTGGFTQCLLMAGVERVYAIDVDTSQLDWKVRIDPRVVQIEGNARYLERSWVPEALDLVTVDVSFISLTKILPAVSSVLTSGGRCLTLVKPQFELGRARIPRGGIVTERSHQEEAVATVIAAARTAGFVLRDRCPAPIAGKEGNQEFFVLFEKS
jgi:23S rRNA (cytidine1920-2'-O)/16S rRNA (cytidine1409-2'-O)-methyltransferase